MGAVKKKSVEKNNLERPLGVKAEKERLKKQKCREGTTSHIEDILNVMMEERRKISAMKMACIEKWRLVDQEHEMAQIQLKDKKLEIARMKMELDMKRSKEEYEMEKIENGKVEGGQWNWEIENESDEGGKRAYDDGCKYVVFSAARIYSSMPNGNSWKTKVSFLDYYHHQCSYFVYD